MIIGVLKEVRNGENRVSAVPETVIKYISWGHELLIETDAGEKAGFVNDDYLKSGARIVSREELWQKSDIILSIWGISPSEYDVLRKGQIMIANFEMGRYPERVEALAKRGITALALEKMPRIARAQGADILSSQNSLAGYKAALVGVDVLNRAAPLMITSAGTIPPAKALVIGAGVAGLQAIATLKRMGAIVFASDVRYAAKEQVESLGGRFLVVDDKSDFEGKGGYALEVLPDFLLKQKTLITEQLKQTDILITTAMSAGKIVPLLVSADMLDVMPKCSVVLDIAGGNVDVNTMRKDIKIIQDNNIVSEIACSASKLFSKNILNLFEMYGGRDFKLYLDDEIMSAICICYNGKIRRE